MNTLYPLGGGYPLDKWVFIKCVSSQWFCHLQSFLGCFLHKDTPNQARGTCLLLLHYLLQQNICRRLDKIIHSLNNTDLMFQRPILHERCCAIQTTLIQFVVEGLSFVGVTFGEDFVGVTGIGSSCSSSWTCMWYLYSFSVVCRWPVIQEIITILSFLIYSTPF